MESQHETLEQLHARFTGLEDPRVGRTKLHQLLDIVTIPICDVICGADDWSEIELLGHAKLAFLRASSPYPTAYPLTIPSTQCSLASTRNSSNAASWNGCKTWCVGPAVRSKGSKGLLP